ncbi:MAG: hypothetical protein M0015_09010 [Betaproteobacteria bacterium]|nr:hypothetical protein [Betaproteobacteria bacterium]
MAVRLRKLRQRFGISAPRVAVHAELPWYWRWLGIPVLIASAAAAAAAWIYHAERSGPGIGARQLEQALERARTELEAKQAELDKVRSVADAAGSRIAIERAAEQKLAEQVRALEQENGRMREDMAIFEKMLSTDWRTAPPLSIYRFKVEPDLLPGEYRYRLLLLASAAGRDQDFQGRLELVVSLTANGKSAIMVFPKQGDAGASAFRLAFKRFQRVEGTFRVDPKSKVDSVQVRVYQNGISQPRAAQSVNLG